MIQEMVVMGLGEGDVSGASRSISSFDRNPQVGVAGKIEHHHFVVGNVLEGLTEF